MKLSTRKHNGPCPDYWTTSKVQDTTADPQNKTYNISKRRPREQHEYIPGEHVFDEAT